MGRVYRGGRPHRCRSTRVKGRDAPGREAASVLQWILADYVRALGGEKGRNRGVIKFGIVRVTPAA